MTVYMSLRQRPTAGGTKSPSFLEGDGTTADLALKAMPDASFVARAGGRDILFATHGFNVSMVNGARALGRLEAALALPPSCLFVGVLWPGDWWIPAINYPFEGGTAADCGAKIADFCNRNLAGVASLSFISHSLGARVVLEAIKGLKVKARMACIAAGAVNDDCLAAQYAAALANCSVISVLASRSDTVLKVAYPVGDPIADLLSFDHKPFAAALGYAGPPAPIGATQRPWQIPDPEGFGHGDYLPPSEANAVLDPAARWRRATGFMRRAYAGERQSWPV